MKEKHLGMRKPETAPGSWNGAFVAYQGENGKVVTAFFDNRMDFIGPAGQTWKDVQKYVKKLEQEGWEPMTREDIQKTAGV